jgi:chromosome partitioning protein
LYDHTNVANDVYWQIRQHFEELLFQTIIPKNIKLEEAHSRTQAIFTYAPASKGAQAYAEFVNEVMNRG